MKKKILLLMACLMAFVLVLAACNGDGTDTETETEPAPVDTVTEDTETDEGADTGPVDQVTIRLGTWETGNGLEIKEQIAADFMDIHPHINVIIESVPDGFGERLLTQLAANDAPDLFQIGDGDIARFQGRGAFADLMPFINGDNPMNLDDFYGPMLEIGRIGDGIYTLPKDFSTMAIFYNRAMFDEAGIDHPTNDWTWEDFREKAIELTTEDRWGAQIISGVRWILPMVYSYGGDVISQDGSTVLGYMDSDGTIEALELLNQMVNIDEAMPSMVELEAFQGVNLFLSEQVAMIATGIWPAAMYLEAELDFGTVMLPAGPAGQYGTIAYAGYGMWAGSPHQEEAWLFLNYLTTEGQHLMAQHALTAFIPAAEAVGQADVPHVAAFIDMIDVLRIFPERLNMVFGSTAGRQFESVLEEIGLTPDGSVNIRELLEEAAERGQEEMEEEMRHFE